MYANYALQIVVKDRPTDKIKNNSQTSSKHGF